MPMWYCVAEGRCRPVWHSSIQYDLHSCADAVCTDQCRFLADAALRCRLGVAFQHGRGLEECVNVVPPPEPCEYGVFVRPCESLGIVHV